MGALSNSGSVTFSLWKADGSVVPEYGSYGMWQSAGYGTATKLYFPYLKSAHLKGPGHKSRLIESYYYTINGASNWNSDAATGKAVVWMRHGNGVTHSLFYDGHADVIKKVPASGVIGTGTVLTYYTSPTEN